MQSIPPYSGVMSGSKQETVFHYTRRTERFSNGVKKSFNLPKLFLFVFLVFSLQFPLFAASPEPERVNWKLNIKWKGVPLSEVPIPYKEVDLRDGKADVSFNIRSYGDEISYSAEGNISDGVVYLSKWNDEIRGIKSVFILEDKLLKVDAFEGVLRDIPISARGDIEFEPPYPFHTQITARDVTVDDISPLLPFIEPYIGPYKAIKTKGEVDFSADGVLPPGPLEGKITLPFVSFHALLMKDIEISFTYKDNEISFRNIYLNVSEGNISGEGEFIIKKK